MFPSPLECGLMFFQEIFVGEHRISCYNMGSPQQKAEQFSQDGIHVYIDVWHITHNSHGSKFQGILYLFWGCYNKFTNILMPLLLCDLRVFTNTRAVLIWESPSGYVI
jgi:hypothetical protein